MAKSKVYEVVHRQPAVNYRQVLIFCHWDWPMSAKGAVFARRSLPIAEELVGLFGWFPLSVQLVTCFFRPQNS